MSGIELLREYPEHHYVSPMVDGVLGAGLDVWQMFDPQTHPNGPASRPPR